MLPIEDITNTNFEISNIFGSLGDFIIVIQSLGNIQRF